MLRAGEVVSVQAEIGERSEQEVGLPGAPPEAEMLPPDPGIGTELAPVPDEIREAVGAEEGGARLPTSRRGAGR
jgi:hypothetical protein